MGKYDKTVLRLDADSSFAKCFLLYVPLLELKKAE